MTEQSTSLTRYDNYQKIKAYGQSPEVLNTFVQLLGKTAPQYIQSALIAVQSNDDLMECSPRSVFKSALRAAALGLSCDPSLGHAYIVPYKSKKSGKEANFQPGWKGIQYMALRTGKYAYINVSPVYEGETVIEDRITGDLTIGGKSTGTFIQIGLIASFKLLTGYKKSIYMSNEELEEHGRTYSKGYSRSDSIWQTNKKMAYHKTILLRLLRTYGYLSVHDLSILNEDEETSVVDADLPDEEPVTIIDRQPLTTDEANKLLGMEDEPSETETYQVVVETPTTNVAKPQPELTKKNKWMRPMPPEVLKEALQIKLADAEPANANQINLVRVLLLEHFADRQDERRQAQEYLTGHKHFNEIEPEMISAMLDWMKPEAAKDGSGAYVLSKAAKIELTMVAKQFMEDLGQQTIEF